jgi:hypothetical protein
MCKLPGDTSQARSKRGRGRPVGAGHTVALRRSEAAWEAPFSMGFTVEVALIALLITVVSISNLFAQMSDFDKYSLQSCITNCYTSYDPRSRPSEHSQCVEGCKRTYGNLRGLDRELPKGIR